MFFDTARKQFIYRRLALLVFFTLVLFSAFTAKAERLPIKTYTVADGLLRDNVYKVKQDSRGFLWFCTAEGVSRFDGYAFTNFTTADGLPDRHANDFLETKNGEIWIATDGGLAGLNLTGVSGSLEKPLFSVYQPENPKAKKFQVLFEDESGTIWAGTSDGLYKLNEKGELAAVDLGKAEPKAETLSISAIIKDRRGAMWIGTNSGLYRITPGGEVERFTRENGLPAALNVSVLREDKDGRIWVGLRPSYAAGLMRLVAEPDKNQNIVEHYYREKEGLPLDWITDLFETSDGKFWVATTRGLCEWQAGGVSAICRPLRQAVLTFRENFGKISFFFRYFCRR